MTFHEHSRFRRVTMGVRFAARRMAAFPARKQTPGDPRHACQLHSAVFSSSADRVGEVRNFTQRQLHAHDSSKLIAIGYRNLDDDPAGGGPRAGPSLEPVRAGGTEAGFASQAGLSEQSLSSLELSCCQRLQENHPRRSRVVPSSFAERSPTVAAAVAATSRRLKLPS